MCTEVPDKQATKQANSLSSVYHQVSTIPYSRNSCKAEDFAIFVIKHQLEKICSCEICSH